MKWSEVLQAVQAAGAGVVDLSIGNPLLVAEVSEELVRSLGCLAHLPDIGSELGSYGNFTGLPALKDAFAARCTRELGCPVSAQDVLVVPGAQAGLRYLQEIVRGQGRRILYPIGLEFPGSVDLLAPHPPALGTYCSRPSGDGTSQVYFDLATLDWENVGAVILSRPHSPTGRLWTSDEIAALAGAAAQHDAWLVLDETYALPFAPITAGPYQPVDAPNMIRLYSFSKMGLTAERVGVVIAPPEWGARLRGILRQSIIQPPLLGQYLALAAIRLFDAAPELAARFGAIYLERWERCWAVFAAEPALRDKLHVARWEGGAFLWCEWSGGPTSDTLFRQALAAGVAIAPRSAIDLRQPTPDEPEPSGMRMGICASLDELETASGVIARILSERPPTAA